MAKPFDAIMKQFLDDHGADWLVWLAPEFGLPAGEFEAIDPELSTVQPIADKVFRLPGNLGLLHLELQSSWGGSLPDRMLVYNTLLFDRYGGPVRSIAILLRQNAEATALTGTLTRTMADDSEYLRFRYGMIRVWEYAADTFLAGGIGLAPLALLTDDAEPRLPELVHRLAERAKTEIDDETLR